MGNKIVVVGSSNTDMIIKVNRIPKPGETVLGGEFSMAPGGKGANQAVSAARAGGEVIFVTRVGDDVFGKRAIEGFIKDNINVENIIHDKNASSGIALIFVDSEGENSIAVASGANANMSPEDIKKSEDVIASASIVLMQLEIPVNTVKSVVDIAVKNNVKIILNPAPAQKLDDNLLKDVFILTPNESEAEILTGINVKDEEGAEKAASVLLEKNIGCVLVTLGPNGVYVASPDFKGLIPGFKVKAVDSTAAGDVFNGALAASLAENKSLIEAIKFSNAAAALSVTKLGAQTSIPYKSEVENIKKLIE